MRPRTCQRGPTGTNPRPPPHTAAGSAFGPPPSRGPVMAARRPRGAAGAGRPAGRGGGGHWAGPVRPAVPRARPPPPAGAENGGAAAAGLLRGAVSGRLPGAGPAGASRGGALAAPGGEHGREDLPAVRRGGRRGRLPRAGGRPRLGPSPSPPAGSAAEERGGARPQRPGAGWWRLAAGAGERRHLPVQSRRLPAQAGLRAVARPGAAGLGSVSAGSQKAAFRVMLLTADGESCSAAVNTAVTSCWGSLQTVRLLGRVKSWWPEAAPQEGAPGGGSSRGSKAGAALRVPRLPRAPSEGRVWRRRDLAPSTPRVRASSWCADSRFPSFSLSPKSLQTDFPPFSL